MPRASSRSLSQGGACPAPWRRSAGGRLRRERRRDGQGPGAARAVVRGEAVQHQDGERDDERTRRESAPHHLVETLAGRAEVPVVREPVAEAVVEPHPGEQPAEGEQQHGPAVAAERAPAVAQQIAVRPQQQGGDADARHHDHRQGGLSPAHPGPRIPAHAYHTPPPLPGQHNRPNPARIRRPQGRGEPRSRPATGEHRGAITNFRGGVRAPRPQAGPRSAPPAELHPHRNAQTMDPWPIRRRTT